MKLCKALEKSAGVFGITVGGPWKLTPQMAFGILALLPEDWDDLAVTVPERRRGGG